MDVHGSKHHQKLLGKYGLFSESSSNMSGPDFVLESEDVQIINGLLEQIVPQDKRMSTKELLCPTNEDNFKFLSRPLRLGIKSEI